MENRARISPRQAQSAWSANLDRVVYRGTYNSIGLHRDHVRTVDIKRLPTLHYRDAPIDHVPDWSDSPRSAWNLGNV